MEGEYCQLWDGKLIVGKNSFESCTIYAQQDIHYIPMLGKELNVMFRGSMSQVWDDILKVKPCKVSFEEEQCIGNHVVLMFLLKCQDPKFQTLVQYMKKYRGSTVILGVRLNPGMTLRYAIFPESKSCKEWAQPIPGYMQPAVYMMVIMEKSVYDCLDVFNSQQMFNMFKDDEEALEEKRRNGECDGQLVCQYEKYLQQLQNEELNQQRKQKLNVCVFGKSSTTTDKKDHSSKIKKKRQQIVPKMTPKLVDKNELLIKENALEDLQKIECKHAPSEKKCEKSRAVSNLSVSKKLSTKMDSHKNQSNNKMKLNTSTVDKMLPYKKTNKKKNAENAGPNLSKIGKLTSPMMSKYLTSPIRKNKRNKELMSYQKLSKNYQLKNLKISLRRLEEKELLEKFHIPIDIIKNNKPIKSLLDMNILEVLNTVYNQANVEIENPVKFNKRVDRILSIVNNNEVLEKAFGKMKTSTIDPSNTGLKIILENCPTLSKGKKELLECNFRLVMKSLFASLEKNTSNDEKMRSNIKVCTQKKESFKQKNEFQDKSNDVDLKHENLKRKCPFTDNVIKVKKIKIRQENDQNMNKISIIGSNDALTIGKLSTNEQITAEKNGNTGNKPIKMSIKKVESDGSGTEEYCISKLNVTASKSNDSAKKVCDDDNPNKCLDPENDATLTKVKRKFEMEKISSPNRCKYDDISLKAQKTKDIKQSSPKNKTELKGRPVVHSSSSTKYIKLSPKDEINTEEDTKQPVCETENIKTEDDSNGLSKCIEEIIAKKAEKNAMLEKDKRKNIGDKEISDPKMDSRNKNMFKESSEENESKSEEILDMSKNLEFKRSNCQNNAKMNNDAPESNISDSLNKTNCSELRKINVKDNLKLDDSQKSNCPSMSSMSNANTSQKINNNDVKQKQHLKNFDEAQTKVVCTENEKVINSELKAAKSLSNNVNEFTKLSSNTSANENSKSNKLTCTDKVRHFDAKKINPHRHEKLNDKESNKSSMKINCDNSKSMKLEKSSFNDYKKVVNEFEQKLNYDLNKLTTKGSKKVLFTSKKENIDSKKTKKSEDSMTDKNSLKKTCKISEGQKKSESRKISESDDSKKTSSRSKYHPNDSMKKNTSQKSNRHIVQKISKTDPKKSRKISEKSDNEGSILIGECSYESNKEDNATNKDRNSNICPSKSKIVLKSMKHKTSKKSSASSLIKDEENSETITRVDPETRNKKNKNSDDSIESMESKRNNDHSKEEDVCFKKTDREVGKMSNPLIEENKIICTRNETNLALNKNNYVDVQKSTEQSLKICEKQDLIFSSAHKEGQAICPAQPNSLNDLELYDPIKTILPNEKHRSDMLLDDSSNRNLKKLSTISKENEKDYIDEVLTENEPSLNEQNVEINSQGHKKLFFKSFNSDSSDAFSTNSSCKNLPPVIDNCNSSTDSNIETLSEFSDDLLDRSDLVQDDATERVIESNFMVKKNIIDINSLTIAEMERKSLTEVEDLNFPDSSFNFLDNTTSFYDGSDKQNDFQGISDYMLEGALTLPEDENDGNKNEINHFLGSFINNNHDTRRNSIPCIEGGYKCIVDRRTSLPVNMLPNEVSTSKENPMEITNKRASLDLEKTILFRSFASNISELKSSKPNKELSNNCNIQNNSIIKRCSFPKTSLEDTVPFEDYSANVIAHEKDVPPNVDRLADNDQSSYFEMNRSDMNRDTDQSLDRINREIQRRLLSLEQLSPSPSESFQRVLSATDYISPRTIQSDELPFTSTLELDKSVAKQLNALSRDYGVTISVKHKTPNKPTQNYHKQTKNIADLEKTTLTKQMIENNKVILFPLKTITDPVIIREPLEYLEILPNEAVHLYKPMEQEQVLFSRFTNLLDVTSLKMKDLVRKNGILLVRVSIFDQLMYDHRAVNVLKHENVTVGVYEKMTDIIDNKVFQRLHLGALLLLHHSSLYDPNLSDLLNFAINDKKGGNPTNCIVIPFVILKMFLHRTSSKPDNDFDEEHTILENNLAAFLRCVKCGVGKVIGEYSTWGWIGVDSPLSKYLECVQVLHRSLEYVHRGVAVVADVSTEEYSLVSQSYYRVNTVKQLVRQ